MKLIGEYSKNSTILLELLTKDENNSMISADFPPTATIEYFDGNGLITVQRVTLEEMEIGRYFKGYIIPDTWNFGDYFITYEGTLDGETLEDKERFQLSESMSLLKQNSAKLLEAFQLIGDPSKDNTTLYDQILAINSQVTQVTVTDLTLLTATGSYTTLIINGVPLQGAFINVWNADSTQVIAKTMTDNEGHWSILLHTGQYIFEFVHPNGTVLRTINKEVL